MTLSVTFVDPYDRFPQLQFYLQGLLEAESSRNWPYLRSVILAEGDGLDRVDEALGHLAEKATTLDEWFPAVVQANPDDGLAAALYAHRGVMRAWDIRTGHRARDLTPAQISGFRAAIAEVEGFLVGAFALHSDCPHLWTAAISSGMGAQVGLSEITRRYDTLSRLTPHWYAAARCYWQAIQPKWYGSWEAALEWARSEAAAAPEGSMMKTLPMHYYIDRWGWETESRSEMNTLIRSETVRQELVAAARGSVLHPAHIPDVTTAPNHTRFAWVLSVGKHWADAWPHFHYLGLYPALSGTWGSLDDPEGAYVESFEEARQAAGAMIDHNSIPLFAAPPEVPVAPVGHSVPPIPTWGQDYAQPPMYSPAPTPPTAWEYPQTPQYLDPQVQGYPPMGSFPDPMYVEAQYIPPQYPAYPTGPVSYPGQSYAEQPQMWAQPRKQRSPLGRIALIVLAVIFGLAALFCLLFVIICAATWSDPNSPTAFWVFLVLLIITGVPTGIFIATAARWNNR